MRNKWVTFFFLGSTTPARNCAPTRSDRKRRSTRLAQGSKNRWGSRRSRKNASRINTVLIGLLAVLATRPQVRAQRLRNAVAPLRVVWLLRRRSLRQVARKVWRMPRRRWKPKLVCYLLTSFPFFVYLFLVLSFLPQKLTCGARPNPQEEIPSLASQPPRGRRWHTQAAHQRVPWRPTARSHWHKDCTGQARTRARACRAVCCTGAEDPSLKKMVMDAANDLDKLLPQQVLQLPLPPPLFQFKISDLLCLLLFISPN